MTEHMFLVTEEIVKIATFMGFYFFCGGAKVL
jgi:hypothetical protein